MRTTARRTTEHSVLTPENARFCTLEELEEIIAIGDDPDEAVALWEIGRREDAYRKRIQNLRGE